MRRLDQIPTSTYFLERGGAMGGEQAQRCSSPMCSMFLSKRFVPWRVTVYYKLGLPGAEDVTIKFVDDDDGEVSHTVHIDSLTDGKKKGEEYRKSALVRFPRHVKAPETAILNATGNVPFSLYVVSIKVSCLFAKYRIPCFSWITRDHGDRIFFGGVPMLPKDVPPAILALQIAELEHIRTKDGKTRSGNDRIYDYDVYNDLGQPEGALRREPLGGTEERPYPRRLRTGRPLVGDIESRPVDPETGVEERFWVPWDDAFDPEKAAGFFKRQLRNGNRARATIVHYGGPEARFDNIDSVAEMYQPAPSGPGFPVPAVFEDRTTAWKMDDEFGRQRIAGTHPMAIEAIRSLPKGSAITDLHITGAVLEGGQLVDRLKEGRMYMVDYSVLLPLVDKINKQSGHVPRFQYASRCVMYSKSNGAIVPVAIELMVPSEEGTVSEVYTPKNSTTEWTLAKTHFTALDFAVHSLHSHFTRAHACTEPYLIATRRNLSSAHPVFRLLMPHFKDTLTINAGGRNDLVPGGGALEDNFTAGVHLQDVLHALYRTWRFKTEGLPADLIKRKMAKAKHGADWRAGHVELTLENYPYAQDGLLLWKAMHKWASSYLSLYYRSSADLAGDTQIQSRWTEIKTKGHPDLVAFGIATEDEVWPQMNDVADLTFILVTIMWVASAHHAAVNFAQYTYAGYMPNTPSFMTRRMPKPDSIETDADVLDEQAFLGSVSAPIHAALVASVTSSLSVHGEGEEFLGEEIPHWLVDRRARAALKDFADDLEHAEKIMEKRNKDVSNPARSFPYLLMHPSLEDGVGVPSSTSRGVPNSITI